VKNLIVITGSRGSGKSTALATIAPAQEMKRVFVLDTENSMSDIVEQVGFGKYVRAYDQYNLDDKALSRIARGDLPWVDSTQLNALVKLYEWFVKTLDKELVKGKFDYVLIDTIEPIEAAMAAAVEAGKVKFGWSGKRAFGGMETEGVRPLYENVIEAIFNRGVHTIGVSTHIKRVWEGNTPVLNKVKPGGRLVVLSRLSTLMVWLVPNVGNPDGAPAGLILKARKGKMEALDDGSWYVRRIYPQRVPAFTWMDLKNYEKEPANLRNPQPGEVPTSGEMEMISEFLTDEQMKLMVVGAELELEAQSGAILTGTPEMGKMDEIASMLEDGKSPVEIARELNVTLNAVREAKAK
jgi:hypothetical protein